MKKIAQSALLFFALGSLCFWAWEKLSGAPATATPDQPSTQTVDHAMKDEASQSQQTVVVTYFTTDVRCKSCLLIESLTQQTLEEQFTQELANGTLHFQTLNIDRQEHQHFTQTYDLAFKTVVVSTERQGTVTHWEKLDEVWTLLNEPEAFKSYMAAPIRSLLSPKL